MKKKPPTKSEGSFGESLAKVVSGGYCIGCGACVDSSEGGISVELDQFGQYQAVISDEIESRAAQNALKVCPFSDLGFNEDDIASSLYGTTSSQDSRIGYYKGLYVGHVIQGDYRKIGTSGGTITWVLSELLRQGVVDAVLHVKKCSDPESKSLFGYGISRSVDEVKEGAKSRYYPVEMSGVLKLLKQEDCRFAIAGLPCFIKAVRKLVENEPLLNSRVVCCVGLVCGHLKSLAFSECFAWQAGIAPDRLEEIDFRVKLDNQSARDYAVYLRGDGQEYIRPSRSFWGLGWGYNFFRYSACDYCDDVFAETADVVVGDAWLPGYVNDSLGNSIIVVRSESLHQIFNTARCSGVLKLEEISADTVALSQAGGLRDRREGLAYRLYLKQLKREWAPLKRVRPNKKGIRFQRRMIYRIRLQLGAMSHMLWAEAVEKGSFDEFKGSMQHLINSYNRWSPLWIRQMLDSVKQRIRKTKV